MTPSQLADCAGADAGRVARNAARCATAAAILLIGWRETTGGYALARIGSFDLSALDVLLVVLACLTARLSARRGTGETPLLPLAVGGLWAIVLVNVLRGIPGEGIDAVRSLRGTAPLLAFLSLAIVLARRRFRMEWIERTAVGGALGVGALGAVRLLVGPDALYFGEYADPLGLNHGGRPLTSAGAMALGFGLLLLLPAMVRSTARSFPAAAAARFGFLLLMLLASRQATAIAATFAGIAVATALIPGPGRAARRIAVSAGLGVLLLAYLSGALAVLEDGWLAGEFAERSGTLGTRQAIWASFIDVYSSSGLADRLLGHRAGSNLGIWLYWDHSGFREWSGSFHSMYVGTLAWCGAIGLALYVALLGSIFSRCVRRSGSQSSAAAGAGLCVAAAVLGFSYEIRAEQGLMLAFAHLAAFRPVRSAAAGRNALSASLQAGSGRHAPGLVPAPAR